MKEDFIEEITFDLFVVELAIADVAILSMIQDNLLPEAPKDGKTYGRNNSEWVAVTDYGEEINRLLPLIYAGL